MFNINNAASPSTPFGLPTNINFRADTEPNGAAIKEEIDPVSVIDLDRHGEDVPPSAVSQSSLAPTPIACDNHWRVSRVAFEEQIMSKMRLVDSTVDTSSAHQNPPSGVLSDR